MLALLLFAPLLQEPAPAAPPEPARAAWQAVLKTYEDAAAIRLRLRIALEDPAAEETEAMTLQLALAAELMRPGAGRILLEGSAVAAGEEPEPIRELYLGDGTAVYEVDDEAREARVQGQAWSDCEPSVGDEQVAFLPAREDHPDWTGLALTGLDLFGEEGTSTAWLDATGSLQSFTIPVGGSAVLVATVESLELLAKADPKDFIRALPEGYEVIAAAELPDLAEGLLPVGAAAPDVRMIGMDDVEFSLASLAGKTVLLNFWFFH
jgi:hypothetical protein